MGATALAVGASVAGSVASSAISSSAQSSAAGKQAAAAGQSAQEQQQLELQNQSDFQPYLDLGKSASNSLQSELPTLTATFQPTMAQLENTPGYQFTKEQGLEATQNGYAAQGLGSSGAAQKGAANYAENLASTTYQQQFQNYMNQNSQIYNMLMGGANLGQTGAANLAGYNVNSGANVGGALTGAGTARAAGTVGSANALGSGLGSLGNSLLQYSGLNQQQQLLNKLTGSTGSTSNNPVADMTNYYPQSFAENA